MADTTALKNRIRAAIKANNNQEITGPVLQQALLDMVDELNGATETEADARQSGDSTLQQAINSEADARQSCDSTLQQNINTEAQQRQEADTQLNNLITGIKNNIDNGYVYAGIAIPSSTPTTGKVFYLALTAGTYTNFGSIIVPQGINILKYNGSAWLLDSFLGLDDAPTQGSNNSVKSGGVLDSIIKNGSAFDLSAYNNGTTYADLSAALTALNVLPAAYKNGGMSMKYVQTSDNKYVQYRLTKNTWSTNTNDWIVAAEVKSELPDYDFAITDDNKYAIARFNNGHIQTKNFDSSKVGLKSSSTNVLSDLALIDDNNNAIVNFEKGHIKTKKFDSSKINGGLRGMIGSYNGYNIITVGTGKDYPTIQEAINSVEDATIDNQYLIVVYDDFYIDSITDLYLDENRSQKVSSITDIDNGKTCAYIFTKDFVHILGKGKRKIHVNIPTNVIDTAARLSCVHNVYWKGFCNIENLQIISQNTRYCIHSEGGGNSPSSEDYCVIKHLKDVECIYKGVSPGGYSQAFGIGTANGQKAFIEGCIFIGEDGARSGYSHTHPNYTYPTSLIFINTKFCDEGVFNSFELVELFSGQNNNLICEGYEGKFLNISYLIAQPVDIYTDFDICHSRIELQGHSNKTRMDFEKWPVLEVIANNVGDNITDISGNAIEPLFKDFVRKINGGLNAVSRWTGCLAHLYNGTDTYNNAFSAIAFMLGDCSVNNKTLTITVGSHTETITFDQNYGGLVGNAPTSNYTDDALIAEINSQLQYCQISKGAIIRRLFFNDEVEEVYNTSDYLLGIDKVVTRDANASIYRNGVKLAQSGDFVYGICAEPISPHSYGYIIKKGKQKIYLSNGNETGLSNVAGKYYGVNENGLMAVTNKADACFFGIDNNTLEWI